jgi:hypothetical protein
VKLSTRFQLAPRTRKVELYLRSPISLHGVVLNLLSMKIHSAVLDLLHADRQTEMAKTNFAIFHYERVT